MARLDVRIVEMGIARSRERAKEMIKSGGISVNGKVLNKPSAEVDSSDRIEALIEDLNYVGRGALKLEKAVDEFGIVLDNAVCIDIGASTGGFTEFMLNKGAAKVFAVDVGHGQLAESLRNDSRVVNAEGTDIRSVTAEFTGGQVDFISVDVSFISLKKILPKINELLKKNGCAVVLIKPQFEAGRENIGKRGIVKDKKVHSRILAEIDEFAVSVGLFPQQYTVSPIKGGSGNIEYLAKLSKSDSNAKTFDFRKLAEEAFNQL
jgi:23S rRNA (cytidine1920-2'-O)/16S rRNA (cytidine1409-2'-O)-methyltransferase